MSTAGELHGHRDVSALALARAELRLAHDFAWARDLISRGGRPISPREIWMDTYGYGPIRLAYPLAMACLPQTSARFLLHDRAIVLWAICLESITSIRR